MHAPNQNHVAGRYIRTYTGAGAVATTYQIPSNVPNGQTQRTILIGRELPPGTADFDAGSGVTGLQITSEGATCYLASLAPRAGIDPDLLESRDDTNNSAADFYLGPPNPRRNSTAPTERPCGYPAPTPGSPETTITRAPRKKVRTRKRRKRARFEFTSSRPGSNFECSVDEAPFEACGSPFRVKVRKGRHEFQVRAVHPTLGADPTPDAHAWKVKRKKRKK